MKRVKSEEKETRHLINEVTRHAFNGVEIVTPTGRIAFGVMRPPAGPGEPKQKPMLYVSDDVTTARILAEFRGPAEAREFEKVLDWIVDEFGQRVLMYSPNRGV
jgi:hypothetical protein